MLNSRKRTREEDDVDWEPQLPNHKVSLSVVIVYPLTHFKFRDLELYLSAHRPQLNTSTSSLSHLDTLQTHF